MKITKILNLTNINRRLHELGLNQSRIAEEIKVSRESVSKWFNSENLPSASKLLSLSKILNLPYEELLITDVREQPLIDYRKNGTAKTHEADIDNAIDMANALRSFINNFDLRVASKPPVLLQPKTDYDFLKKVAAMLRDKLNISNDVLSLSDLISIFNFYNATIIPVLWGRNKRHANALRIYLHDSMTTWVYLNLNTKLHDFKFWLTHELGHVLAPELKGKEAEIFADGLAGALLFPEGQAEELYLQLLNLKTDEQKARKIVDKSKIFMISPLSVYKQTICYAINAKKPPIIIEPLIYKFNSTFHKYFTTVAYSIFNTEKPTAESYINFVSNKFKSKFFVYLERYIEEKAVTPTYIQILLDISFIDAQNIYYALRNPSK